MKTKTCARCRLELPLEAFHKKNQMKDGHNSYCKKCMLDYVHEVQYRSVKKPVVKSESHHCLYCFKFFPKYKNCDYKIVVNNIEYILCKDCYDAFSTLIENRHIFWELAKTIEVKNRKLCDTCNQWLPLREFNDCTTTEDRKFGTCKLCLRKQGVGVTKYIKPLSKCQAGKIENIPRIQRRK